MKRTSNRLLILLAAAVMVLCNFCKDDMDGKLFLTSDEVAIDEYILERDRSMTLFLDIVEKADMSGTIHARGTYTCFIPTNDAVNSYLQSEGKNSVSDLTAEECKRIVKYHMVNHGDGADAVPLMSSDFIDGRLPLATMLAKYLTTRTVDAEGGVKIRVNRQAEILKNEDSRDKDGIRVTNGCIHKMSSVLTPPTATCGEMVRDSLPATYSLFKQVLEHTGWVQRMIEDKANLTWYTVFLQANEAFTSEGINDMDGLADFLVDKLKELVIDPVVLTSILRFDPTFDIDDQKEVALWMFAAYHCVKDLYYAADLINAPALLTSAPNQTITVKVKKDTLLLNEYINKNANQYEAGRPVLKSSDYTDMSCYNGVLVDVNGYIGPQKRGAQAVFWEITEQPEFIKNPKYRKEWFNLTKAEVEALSEMKVTYQSGASHTDAVKTDDNGGTFYYSYRPSYDTKVQFSYSDGLGIKMSDIASIELTLPLLTPGDYNVWIGWRRADVNACRARATYIEGDDEFELGSVGFHENFDTGKDALILLAQGMKRYTAKERSGTMNCRKFGTVRVNSTGRHKMRLDVIERGRGTTMWIDQLQFIPVDDDQLWPRFDIKGNRIELGAACDQIEPKNRNCSADNDVK